LPEEGRHTLPELIGAVKLPTEAVKSAVDKARGKADFAFNIAPDRKCTLSPFPRQIARPVISPASPYHLLPFFIA